MDKTSLIDKVKQMANKRDYLLQLRDKPDIGGLRLDVNQALGSWMNYSMSFKQLFLKKNLVNYPTRRN